MKGKTSENAHENRHLEAMEERQQEVLGTPKAWMTEWMVKQSVGFGDHYQAVVKTRTALHKQRNRRKARTSHMSVERPRCQK